ncbi:hypothetical protein Theam_1286 [Thermovibrio ammonificans HB-1]|uniref:Uncharacterized protein n=1 Tax=Thermovibrio ammonificans (strain DSM 15698 / JCM 12110 / HB-1) TaxID=648996 RepID=E8T3B7_THEA1|nr:hypothetical protein [Thermovibrio ammonificans]ADU97249.1 hypothetical protein Theam_1286 [Thermovibrio ammonificans HB-1]
MQVVKGRIFKLQDLLILLDMATDRNGRLILYLPYKQRELSLCYRGDSFIVEGATGDPKFEVISFIEEWLRGEIPANFELYDGELCEEGKEIDKEELIKIVGDPLFKEIDEIPDHFEIVTINVQRAPSFLVAHWTAKRPVNSWEVYNHGVTLFDILKLINDGALTIKPYSAVESFPTKLRLLMVAVAAVTLLYYVAPFNYTSGNVLKLNKAINWALTYKIILTNPAGEVELPVKGCFRTHFYLQGNRVINPGLDQIPGTGDDTVARLPNRGYKPVYAIPEK